MSKEESKVRKNESLSFFDSIIGKVTLGVLALAIIPLIILGMMSIRNVNKTIGNRINSMTQQNLTSIQQTIDENMRTYESVISQMSESAIIKNYYLERENKEYVRDFLLNIKNSDDAFETVYFGFKDKDFLIQIDDGRVGYDPTERDWYEGARNSGGIYFSDAYEDFLTKQQLITVSKEIYIGGEVVGVVALDVSLESLQNMFMDISFGESGYLSIIDRNNIAIFHPDQEILGNEVFSEEPETLESIKAIEDGEHRKVNVRGNDVILYKTEDAVRHWNILGIYPASEFTKDAQFIQKMIIIVILVAVALIIAIAIKIGKSTRVKVNEIVHVLEEASNGNLRVRLSEDSSTEIGVISRNFNNMIEQWKNIIGTVISSANTTYESSGIINTTLQESAETMENVAQVIQGIANGVVNQAEDISVSLENMEGLANEINEIDNKTEEMSKLSHETLEYVEGGSRVMDSLLSTTDRLGNETSHMSEVILDMESVVGRIGAITDTINNISEQTNLLALNAAIEAARAGESGRGFSVVASEIRSLAEESQNATLLIQGLIDSVTEQSSQVVSAMESSRKIVLEEEGYIKESEEVFGNILGLIQNIDENINMINENVRETNLQKDGMLKRLENVSAIAFDNSASIEEVSASSEEIAASLNEFEGASNKLEEISKEMKENVEIFEI